MHALCVCTHINVHRGACVPVHACGGVVVPRIYVHTSVCVSLCRDGCVHVPSFVHLCVVTQSHPLLVGLCGVGGVGRIRTRWDLQRCHCSSALRCPTAGRLLGVGGGDAPSATPALQVGLFARKLLLVFAAWARATRCGQRCSTLAMTPSPPRTCLALVLPSHIT